MSLVPVSDWKTFLETKIMAHLLQTAEWGELKANFGWKVDRIIVGNAGAQILTRRILPGIKFAYIPKGPVGITWESNTSSRNEWNNLLDEIDRICREEHVFILIIEPDLWESSEKNVGVKKETEHIRFIPTPEGFLKENHSIQPQRTIVIDLLHDEDRIMGRMKQKTRYNIKLAKRKDIVIHPSADIPLFYRLMEETSERDKFVVHDRTYYQKAYDLFQPRGYCELLIADYQNEPVAGLMVFAYRDRSWYLYGASSGLHRERMPTYLIQWEAMRWAKSQGCHEYDLWGVPDADLEILEQQFTQRTDGLWGVYRFKRGFGGELRRQIGPWVRVYNPLLYSLYKLWLSRRVIPGD